MVYRPDIVYADSDFELSGRRYRVNLVYYIETLANPYRILKTIEGFIGSKASPFRLVIRTERDPMDPTRNRPSVIESAFANAWYRWAFEQSVPIGIVSISDNVSSVKLLDVLRRICENLKVFRMLFLVLKDKTVSWARFVEEVNTTIRQYEKID